MANLRKARDIKLLDKLDACPRLPFNSPLWRVAREGRDPLLGARSISRWCTGAFDVLYASLERDGALAEIHALLASQPVFPSKLTFRVHTLTASVPAVLHLADLKQLAALGVEVARYRERDYHATQDIADAALFLGFDGLIVPSARWSCANAVLFTDRVDPTALVLADTEPEPVNWAEWRKAHRGPGLHPRGASGSARAGTARRQSLHSTFESQTPPLPDPKRCDRPEKPALCWPHLVPLREARCRALGSPGRGRRPRTCLARTHPASRGTRPPAIGPAAGCIRRRPRRGCKPLKAGRRAMGRKAFLPPPGARRRREPPGGAAPVS